jgi:hypothetical protein
MLEPDVVKVASPVLGGLGAGNGSWLLGEAVIDADGPDLT